MLIPVALQLGTVTTKLRPVRTLPTTFSSRPSIHRSAHADSSPLRHPSSFDIHLSLTFTHPYSPQLCLSTSAIDPGSGFSICVDHLDSSRLVPEAAHHSLEAAVRFSPPFTAPSHSTIALTFSQIFSHQVALASSISS